MLRLALRLALALPFAIAAIVKIKDPQAFFDAVQTYHLLDRTQAAVVAVWMPWLELVLAAALWFPRFARVSSATIGMLCVVFLVALAQAWIRDIDITCGCFGTGDVVQGKAYIGYLARDVALVGIAVALWLLDAKAAPAKASAASQP